MRARGTGIEPGHHGAADSCARVEGDSDVRAAEERRRSRGSGRPGDGQLAAYRVLFEKRVGGAHDSEYVGLDFGHLRDLAAIDHMLRYTLLPMTLDIEHFAKVRLMREVTDRADEDGYSIVADYLESLSERNRSIREKEMERLKRDRYSGGMARKYDEEKPVWVLIELLSFGGFINFYLFCADRWKDRRMRSEHYLFQVIPSREERLRPFHRHHKRLRARRDKHHPHPEGGRAGARRDGHQQACEASKDGQPARPADNDDGVRLQGDGRGLPHEGDVQGPGRCPKVSRRRARQLVHEH